ncbi:MAG: MFS transporter [Promethearchaeota archaeon]
MNFLDFWKVFSIPTTLNAWTIGLLIFFVGSVILGYIMMASQVKIVKKEFWKGTDTLKCFIFGFFFGSALTVIGTTIITFIFDLNDLGYHDQAILLILPMVFCLIFVSIYPLIEFLFMAHFSHYISTTPFQKPFESLIKKFRKPWSYIIAVILYFVVMVLPIIIMVAGFQIKFIIAWLSWQLIYPMIIILYYASVGYIIAFGIFTISIPYLPRSTFLHHDKSKRAVQEFFRDPGTYFTYFTLFYSYIYFIYRTYATLTRFDLNYVAYYPPWYNVDWSIPISLAFAVTAYYHRYWKRKVKSSTQSILFSTFLIAAMGVNIMLNYLISRPFVFQELFEKWVVTAELYDVRGFNILGNPVGVYTELNLIGVIEELMLFVIISYFFFIQKNHKAIRDTFFGTVTSSEEKFNPIPAFNMIRFQDEFEQQFAYESLERMYTRIPNKRGYDFIQNRFRLPLFDALSDRSHRFGYYWSQKLLTKIMSVYPMRIAPLVENGLQSPNSDLISSIFQCFTPETYLCLKKIDEKLILFHLNGRNLILKQQALKILLLKYTNEEDSQLSPSDELLEAAQRLLLFPDYNIQSMTLRLLANFPEQVDHSIFLSRLNDPIPVIQNSVAHIAGEIAKDEINSLSIPKLIEMASDINPNIRVKVLDTLAKMGNFEKNNIPIEIFKDNMFDPNDKIRQVSFHGLRAYLQEKPYAISVNYLLEITENTEIETQKYLITLFPPIWKQNPSKILSILKKYLKMPEHSLSRLAQEQILKMAQQDPRFLVSELIYESETESILTRGKIAQTILQICLKFPKQTIPLLIKNLSSTNTNAKINAARVLTDFSKNHTLNIPLKTLVNIWRNEPSENIKNELIPLIKYVGLKEPNKIAQFIEDFSKIYAKSSKALKLSIAKMFSILSAKNPNLIPLKLVEKMVEDPESSIREQGYNILSKIEDKNLKKRINILKKGLKEEDLNIKKNVIQDLMKLALHLNDSKLFTNILKLLDDSNKWTRKAVWDALALLENQSKNVLDVKKILSNIDLNTEVEEVIYSFLKWAGMLSKNEFEQIFPYILKLMEHEKESIRTAAISTLVRLSENLKSDQIIPRLLSYLSDETPVRLEESVVLALNRIAKYEKKEIKERVIRLLSIRAHNTQNKIFQHVLADLKK